MNEAVLVIDKCAGPTSFDVVREVKKLVRDAKVGHSGSLDPFATGVLVIMLGKATKLSGLLLNADKRYRAVVQLGESTDTMDVTGQVLKSQAVPSLDSKQIEAVLQSFEGEWLQTPPMYSAKKLHGVRLYDLARQNIWVKRQPIPVQLYEVRLLKWESPCLELEVHCSKGTYVRSLADEIGKRLGTVGFLKELRRLACGNFTLMDSLTIDDLSRNTTQALSAGYANYLKLLRGDRLIRGGKPKELSRSSFANQVQ
jgi:tRNA pseudouridine55 synthase